MDKQIGVHMLIGFSLVFTPLFGIIHELGHVIPDLLLGSRFVFITWTTCLCVPHHRLALMAGPITEILFVYGIGHFLVGFDTMYIIFFPFIMHGGADWKNAQYLGFNGEVHFLIFTAIMVVLSIRRIRRCQIKTR